MRSYLILAIIIVGSLNTKSQYPDLINIVFADSIKSQKDCALVIKLVRNEKEKFKFPKKYTIGEITSNVDLVYNIEKWENGKYVSYRCNKSPIPIPEMLSERIDYGLYNTLVITDSLQAFECIEKGSYRIQIQYNFRGDFGSEAPAIYSSSNWETFTVLPVRILLGYSRRVNENK